MLKILRVHTERVVSRIVASKSNLFNFRERRRAFSRVDARQVSTRVDTRQV